MDNKVNIIEQIRELVDYVVNEEEKHGSDAIELIAIVKTNEQNSIRWKLYSTVESLIAADLMRSISDLTYTEVTSDSVGGTEDDQDDVG